ncbi:orotate phosphoribosyltransferase [Bifidobacterium sp. SMB2]|uniref:Orotate phosphoribosyltransferase n=1 Tax=Bifidobacterium saimiriisciurei TaxID=2661627 RepID=A0ABX0CB73_9BIFI|nr:MULTISPECIES: orotate phosphoribosyltransferase [Bifidobacterium]NEG96271.1 orotate phosphoribosyltransferase [Bifidobacterium sp. SMB2]NEH12356.1 orotate phosphoribosyltransferase [Bifidobacterium saimiriisciurei]
MTLQNDAKTEGFRKTGPSDVRDDAATPDGGLADDFFDAKDLLRRMLVKEVADKPFSELSAVAFDHQGATLIGHTLLDVIEEQGYGLDDFDAVGALTAAAVPLACAMVHAAASRGQDLDAFVMDFVYPSIKGPSIKGKRVILLDSWLSEKSYVQTSSLVTLRNGNELSLDFGVVKNEGAEILAVASLIGGVDMTEPVVKVVNPADGEAHELPFIEVFKESELRGRSQS